MAGRQYSYQYETSPRKIKPDYSKPKRNTSQSNKTKVKTNAKPKVNKPEKKVIKNRVKKQEDVQAKKALIAKTKVTVFFKCALLFLIVFFMIFMNTRLSESISQIQKLKAQIIKEEKVDDISIIYACG